MWTCLSSPVNKYQWVDEQAMLSFAQNRHIVFWSGCAILYSYQQWMRIPQTCHPFLPSYSACGQKSIQWYLTIALICMSLITHIVQHLFISLIAICILYLMRYLFRSLALLKLLCWVLGVLWLFRITVCTWWVFWKYFLLFYSLSSHSLEHIAEVLKFSEAQVSKCVFQELWGCGI